MKTLHPKLVVTWFLAGFMAMASLAGPGLHSILGIRHSHQFGHQASGGDVGKPVLLADHGAACDEAGCPICNYLAQGRIIGERFEGISVTLGIPNEAPEVYLFLPGASLRPFQARGPPAA
jgi:hypothetical protein